MSSSDDVTNESEPKSKKKKNSLTSETMKQSIEDEAWRSYLENDSVGLTIASSDEDTAGALATLYEYYKVPVPKRQKMSTVTPIETHRTKVIKGQSEVKVYMKSSRILNSVETGGPIKTRTLNPINSSRIVGQLVGAATMLRSDLAKAAENSSFVSNSVGLSVGPLDQGNGSINVGQSGLSSKPESPQHDDNYSTSIIHNMENPDDMFHYSMEAPKSLKQKENEPTMSYINKGQYYCITLRVGNNWVGQQTSRVRSIVSVVFGDGKPEQEQLKHWKYWHSRQHTTKQRVIDIADYKESAMVANIHEFSHNAISFRWDTDQKAKIFIAVNCLSTDFSAQKGIKGMPLLLQIDTYSMTSPTTPIHRAAAQIKVFCDKGAERKIRDEERKSLKKKQKNTTFVVHPNDIKGMISTGRKFDIVYFRTLEDTSTTPIYFTPDSSNSIADPMTFFQSRQRPSQIPVENEPSRAYFYDQQGNNEGLKNDRNIRLQKFKAEDIKIEDGFKVEESGLVYTKQEVPSKILLYVKREEDNIFDALMLRSPTVNGLKEAIAEKFELDYNKISKIFKKQKRGILVNMDDNIIAHYSHEDTFIIDFIHDEDGFIKVSLIEYILP